MCNYPFLLFATSMNMSLLVLFVVTICTICHFLSAPSEAALFVSIGLFAPPGPGVKSLARGRARYFTVISFAFLSWALLYFSVVGTTVKSILKP